MTQICNNFYIDGGGGMDGQIYDFLPFAAVGPLDFLVLVFVFLGDLAQKERYENRLVPVCPTLLNF